MDLHALPGATPARSTRRPGRLAGALALAASLLLSALPSGGAVAQEARVPCDSGALIARIALANSTQAADSFELTPGCTYNLSKIDNNTEGANGLPVIQNAGALTITGNGATIRRAVSGPQFRILAVAPGASLTLRRVTLSGGIAVIGNGGGILNRGALTLEESTVAGNLARGSSGNGSAGGLGGGLGGGVYNAGSLTLTRSTISGNEAVGGNGVARSNSDSGGGGGGAGGLGGAIYNEAGGSVTLLTSTLSGNIARGGPGGRGGGSGSNYGGGGGGGGVGGPGGGNSNGSGLAGGPGGFAGGGGGGGGSAGGNRSTVSPPGPGGDGGFAGGGGGAGVARRGGAGAQGGIGGVGAGRGGASGGSAAGGGGGGAGLGGAIFSAGGSVSLTSSTLTANSALGGDGGAAATSSARGAPGTGSGGAVYTLGGTLSYRNTILSGNSASVAAAADCFARGGTLASQGFNLAGAGCPALAGGASPDIATTSPRLGPLEAVDGVPTRTHLPLAASPATAASPALPASPAIDAGAPECGQVDQRLAPRPQGLRCDIGSVEAASASNPAITIPPTEDALAEAIKQANDTPGPDTIVFATDGPSTIAITKRLPDVEGVVLIDGTSGPGCAGEQWITLRWQPASPQPGVPGLTLVEHAGVTICGLIIEQFSGAGILIPGPGGNTLVNNTIRNNDGAGIDVTGGAAGNRIERNSISTNGGLGIAIAPGVPVPATPSLGPVAELDATATEAGGIAATVRLTTEPNRAYTVDLFASPPCELADPRPGAGEGQFYLGYASFPATAAGGERELTVKVDRIPNDLAGKWITAVATDNTTSSTTRSSAFSRCAAVLTNDLWTNARALALAPTTVASQRAAQAAQPIASPYQERWFTFPVEPDSRIRIRVSAQPGSAVSLHRELPLVYRDLASPQDADAQAAAELPTGLLPTGLLPTGLLPTGLLPTGLLPTGLLPTGLLPTGLLPTGLLPTGLLPGGYVPDAFLPGGYYAAGVLPQTITIPPGPPLPLEPELYTGAIRDSLIAFAASLDTGELQIDRNSWDLDENLYIRVTGPAAPGSPFTLQLTVDEGLCSNLGPITGQSIAGAGPANTGLKTLIFWDSTRIQDTAERARIQSLLSGFVTSENARGVATELVNLGATVNPDGTGGWKYARVQSANTIADANQACPAAKNAVAREIQGVVAAYRAANPAANPAATTLSAIVLAGDDGVIPFFRYPDRSGLGFEDGYQPILRQTSPAEAALRKNRVLGQDEYGSRTRIWRGSSYLPVPEIPVGRLVGGSAGIAAQLNAYSAAPVVTPGSALVTGYDFVADAAQTVSAELLQGLNPADCQASASCRAVQDLISDDRYALAPGATSSADLARPADLWSADQLKALLFGSTAAPSSTDLVFFNGHFDASRALAANFDLALAGTPGAVTESNTIFSTDILKAVREGRADFSNSIIFGLGCHSGYNVPQPDRFLLGGTTLSPDPDWGDAFAQSGATLIGSTSFAYGDTEVQEYGERFAINFSRQLRTGLPGQAVAVGTAHVRAKQAYLAEKATLSGIDEKSLVAFTIYGLPMLQVNMPGQRIAPPSSAPVTPAAVAANPFGLAVGQVSVDADPANSAQALRRVDRQLTQLKADGSVDTSLNPTGAVTGSYFTGPDGAFVANPLEPILPLVRRDVGAPDKILRGVVFRGGTFSDSPNITPLTSIAATELSPRRTSFFSDIFYPSQNWGTNSFPRLAGGAEQLMVIPAQYISNGSPFLPANEGLPEQPLAPNGIMRLYRSMQFQLFYVDDWSDTTGDLKQAVAAAAPEIAEVARGCSVPFGKPTADQRALCAFVVDKAGVGIQQVTLTYIGAAGAWASVDLLGPDANNPTLWTTPAGFVLPAGAPFMLQAVNRAGRVSVNTGNGSYFRPGAAGPGENAAPTQLKLTDLNPPPATFPARYGEPFALTLTLTGPSGAPVANQLVDLTVAGIKVAGVTGADGKVALPITLKELPGDYVASASFGGSPGFQPATGTLTVQLRRGISVLTLRALSGTEVPAGSPTSILATLASDKGQPIDNRTVLFLADSVSSSALFIKEVKTDQQGRAFLASVDWPVGEYLVSAYFGGPPVGGWPDGVQIAIAPDPYYEPSQATTTTSGGVTIPVRIVVQPALPETTILTGPAAGAVTSSTTVTFTYAGVAFSSVDGQPVAPAGFQCSLTPAGTPAGSVPWQPCPAPSGSVTYGPLADGAYTFWVRAVDALGRVDPSPATRSFSVAQNLYRATQQGARIWFERNIDLAGLGDVDTKPKDGWALVGSTDNGANGTLLAFWTQVDRVNGVDTLVPYAVAFNGTPGKDARCMLLRPERLDPVRNGDPRRVTVADNDYRISPTDPRYIPALSVCPPLP
jgi:parallel beta-helix repeat protein